MIIYEVNLIVENSIRKEFLEWLNTHITEMLGFKGFEKASIFEDITKKDRTKTSQTPQSTDPHFEICVQYQIKEQQHLDHYFNNNAQKMRKDGLNRFNNQFKANRRILSFII